jgi:hypothetical protein
LVQVGSATRRMQWQTVATAVCGSANRAAPRSFRGHAKPETYWRQVAAEDDLGSRKPVPTDER